MTLSFKPYVTVEINEASLKYFGSYYFNISSTFSLLSDLSLFLFLFFWFYCPTWFFFFWFSFLSEDNIRLFLGSLAIVFSLNYFFFSKTSKTTTVSIPKGSIWGTISGFTSFGIHAGGLPYNIYMLPQKLDHRVYVGTGAIFFGLVNLIKIYPYYLLDQLRIENITIALFLMPFAPLGFFIGYKLTQKIDGEKFYALTYACLLVIGIKLLMDGI